MKFRIFLLLLILINSVLVFSQIQFDQLPIDKQLIGRDLSTNSGHAIISGTVDTISTKYDSIVVDVYRDMVFIKKHVLPLHYTSYHIGSFYFDIEIPAELANYTLGIFGKRGYQLTYETTVHDIVAGDVYVILGQSNAEAKMRSGSANYLQDDFVRSYACGTEHESQLTGMDKWFIADGDGNRYIKGNVGQWGLKLGKSIVDSLQIPVAIFNGAHDGQSLDFFVRPNDYKTSLASNYGRLFFRLDKTKLASHVRAIFWSQGEKDANHTNPKSTIEYMATFSQIKNGWEADFVNLEKVYIFQTKNGCNKHIDYLMPIKEAQRRLAANDSMVEVMSTAAISHGPDDCHFSFNGGYEVFADRIFPIVLRDMYQVSQSDDVSAPMIVGAEKLNDSTVVMTTNVFPLNADSLITDFEIKSSLGEHVISAIEVLGNKVFFTTLDKVGYGGTISYLGPYFNQGGFITNSTGTELVCFYEFPIQDLITSSNEITHENLLVYPNPTTGGAVQVKLNGFVGKDVQVVVKNVSGQVVWRGVVTDEVFTIDLPSSKGVYFLQMGNEQMQVVRRIIVQ